MYSIYAALIFGLALSLVLLFKNWKDRSRLTIKRQLFRSFFIGFAISVAGAITAVWIIEQHLPTIVTDRSPAKILSLRDSPCPKQTFVIRDWSLSGYLYTFSADVGDGKITPVITYDSKNLQLKEDPTLNELGYWHQSVKVIDRSSPLLKWTVYDHSKEEVQETYDELLVPQGSVEYAIGRCI